MGTNYYGSTFGPNFITARFIADQASALAASQTSGSTAASAAHDGKVVLVDVAADSGFSGLTGSVQASVTGVISGALAGY